MLQSNCSLVLDINSKERFSKEWPRRKKVPIKEKPSPNGKILPHIDTLVIINQGWPDFLRHWPFSIIFNVFGSGKFIPRGRGVQIFWKCLCRFVKSQNVLKMFFKNIFWLKKSNFLQIWEFRGWILQLFSTPLNSRAAKKQVWLAVSGPWAALLPCLF